MQVILDSSFAHPGSAPIWGGKKVEFRDWTNLVQTLTCLPDLVVISLPITSSSDSISTSLSLSFESLSYSSTWLKSAVEMRVIAV